MGGASGVVGSVCVGLLADLFVLSVSQYGRRPRRRRGVQEDKEFMNFLRAESMSHKLVVNCIFQ